MDTDTKINLLIIKALSIKLELLKLVDDLNKTDGDRKPQTEKEKTNEPK